jgi:hypothetical protein
MRQRHLVGAFLILLVAGLGGYGARPKVSAPVNADSIRRVVPGMSKTEVTAILGTPLGQRDNGPGTTYDYALPGLALRSLWFWVAFDARDRVDTVRVEEDPLFAESYAIYDAREGRPVYEHPQFAHFVPTQR